MSTQYYEGVGRRKAATARVRLFPGGKGNIIINDKPAEEYMPREGDLMGLVMPLVIVGQERSYDVSIHVEGGGVTGQRDAIKLGLARALLKVDEGMRPALKAQGLLKRDARVKERKKPGLAGARRRFQFSKR